jgi:hypothetical protein
MTDVDMIQSLANCTSEQAILALNEHGTVEAAVDALMVKPVVGGEKYIPPPRVLHPNNPEQEERCAKGRMLMDKLTALSSAAQTKIRSGQQLAGGVAKLESQAPDEQKELTVPVSES